MNMSTKGIIIREQTVGENDRLVTMLTGEYGVIKAFVRGAKKLNNRKACASLFAYCDFIIYKGKDAYIIDEVKPIEVFFGLRSDLVKLSLAQYFAQLTLELADEEQNCNEFLRVLLNALHIICKGKMPYNKIKAVVEFRFLSLGGYMPSLLGCESCGRFESNTMFFDIHSGHFYCDECSGNGGKPLNAGTFSAIRYICLSDAAKIFSFKLNDDSMAALADAAQEYLLYCLNRRFTALDFYSSLV